MYDLAVTGACGPGILDALRLPAVPWQVRFDLRQMRFCEPLGLVGVAALAEAAVREEHRVVVRRPIEDRVANYLSRMRLGHVLAALGAEHDLPLVNEWDTGDALLELTSFDGARGAGALASHVHKIVEWVDLDAANALHDGICEAGQNVAHHSERDRGFVAAQRLPGEQLKFAVGDSGVGMFATLARRGAADDSDALRRALEPGVTQTPDTSRGNGLPDMLDQVSRLGGRLEIISGGATLTASGNRRFPRAARPIRFPGTLLQGTLSTAR